jgi:hypothetical protein
MDTPEMFYDGTRTNGVVKVNVHQGISVRPLPARNDLFNHSPSGFEYGYGGSGPAQLALAILAHHLRFHSEDFSVVKRIARLDAKEEMSADDLAVRVHQQYKFAVIAGLRGDHFRIYSKDVTGSLKKLAGERESK